MIYEQIAQFIALGLLGGFTHMAIEAKAWLDLIKFESVREIVLGGISGGLYWVLYSDHAFPNWIMAFVVGYSGVDFIIKLVTRLTGEEETEEKP